MARLTSLIAKTLKRSTALIAFESPGDEWFESQLRTHEIIQPKKIGLTYWCWNILRAKYLCCSWRRRNIHWTAALNPWTLLYCAGYQKNWKNSCEIIKIKQNRLRHNFAHMQKPHAYSHQKKKHAYTRTAQRNVASKDLKKWFPPYEIHRKFK